ncbi:guanine nucleotide exchange factor [Anaeramoeba flamelloides]|uniref:Guanine nucleotide exchange factor n=1 Tax=Anaeramoeba flamelloides TaxID=1746091 RepID=A0ABQ8XPX1_9EUKA|nr:guanine nucleotide exchange factor [Anaeramoeba flamelloides]
MPKLDVNDYQLLEQRRKKGKPLKPKIPKKMNWKYINIFEIDPEEVARQITLSEYKIFNKLEFTEFLNQSWNKEERFPQSPTIRKMIDRFNKFNYWVCTLILQAEKLSQRIKILTYFIQLADHFKNLNNFNYLMATLSSLHSNSILRLKHTFKQITHQNKQKLEEFDQLMSGKGAYKTYRAALKSAFLKGQSCIPFIGIHLTDLTFLDESRSDYDENGEISKSKLETMVTVISNILVFQTRPYSLTDVPRLQEYFTDFPGLNNDQLYELSLQREPRNSNIEDL